MSKKSCLLEKSLIPEYITLAHASLKTKTALVLEMDQILTKSY